MSVSFTEKDRYTADDLLTIMKLLRAPGGCPWDAEQTHESIRSNLIEEAHEAVEAIDNRDKAGLCEELGDVLLQVVFHAQMAQETGDFTFDDVADGICKKLIVRHPHVFADAMASDAGAVLRQWDEIKRATKGAKTQSELLKSVPRSMPALMRAEKVQGRARRVGFDWPDVSGALDALDSEVAELKEAIASSEKNPAALEEELGDVLFSAVNVSRFLKVDPELSLDHSTAKFIRRFERVEALAAERQIDMKSTPIEELDKLWALAKEQV